MLSTAKLNATGHRWVAELADFDQIIKYRPGKENSDADGLSRMPCDIEVMMQECTEEMSFPSVQATVQAVESDVSHTVMSMMSFECAKIGEDTPTPFSRVDICQAQRDDPTIGPVIACKQSKEKPTRQQLVIQCKDQVFAS